MTSACRVDVLELAAWGFDEYPYRPASAALRNRSQSREVYQQQQAMQAVSADRKAALHIHEQRPDLAYEMRGLKWSTGIVDLRALLSFQRRLAFDPLVETFALPKSVDEAALLELCFAPQKPVEYRVETDRRGEYVVRSNDPNLQMRASAERLSIYAGSPFLEAAEYRQRWFLRDGYHRAYTLLQRGICCVPAVIVHARSLSELGATQPRFFSEEILFSNDPPRVVDFLDDSLTVRYNRPALLRQLRVTVEESFVPATPSTTEGET